MKHILCFGDSNTYGCDPETWGRFQLHERWTGLLQETLGNEYRIIEEGLGGRTTVFDDQTSPHRSGVDYLLPCLQSHQPLDLVIIMLGTNDCKGFFANSAYDIARGMSRLARVVLNPQNWERGSRAELMLVSPAPLGEGLLNNSVFDEHFGPLAIERSKGLARHFSAVAKELGCRFLDAGSYCSVSETEGVHLDREAHRSLAAALAVEIKKFL